MPEEIKKPTDEQDTGVTVWEDAAPEGDNPADEAMVEVDEQGNEMKPAVKETKPNADAGSKPEVKTKEQPQGENFTKAQVEQMMRGRLKELKALEEELVAQGYGTPTEVLARLQAARQQQEAERVKSGDPTAIASMVESRINDHPAIQEAKRLTQQRQMETEIGELLRKYPDATKEAITQTLAYKEQEGHKNLKAAYAELFADAIEQKMRLKVQERQTDNDKRGVESSDDAPARADGFKASLSEVAWAKDAVRRGLFKNIKEAVLAKRDPDSIKIDF